MIRLKADGGRLRRTIRRREVEAVFRHAADDTFEDALELGAGDGAQSRLVARYARHVLASDLNGDRLEHSPHPRVTYEVCDAMELPYESERFDLVYSSNLLEHIPDPARALSEMRRVLRDDGVMVHIVPNRLWKILHLALFYPNEAVTVLEAVLAGGKTGRNGEVPSRGNNLARERAGFLRRHLWPTVHGEYPGHLAELAGMGVSYWRPLFAEARLELVGMVPGLPVHSPYRFGLELPRRICERAGLSSCNGYVLKKAGHDSPRASLLVAPARS